MYKINRCRRAGKKLLIVFTCVIYFLGIFIGYLYGRSNETNLDDYIGKYSFPRLSDKLGIQEILSENLKLVMFLSLGGFILGVPTFINIFLNGYLLGVVIALYSEKNKSYQSFASNSSSRHLRNPRHNYSWSCWF